MMYMKRIEQQIHMKKDILIGKTIYKMKMYQLVQMFPLVLLIQLLIQVVKKTITASKIIQYDEPQATISGDLGFSELGIDEVNTFSKNEGDSNTINFTDYKDAYTTESKLIDPNSVIIDRPDSIGKYKNERENINFIMSEEQKQLEIINKKKWNKSNLIECKELTYLMKWLLNNIIRLIK